MDHCSGFHKGPQSSSMDVHWTVHCCLLQLKGFPGLLGDRSWLDSWLDLGFWLPWGQVFVCYPVLELEFDTPHLKGLVHARLKDGSILFSKLSNMTLLNFTLETTHAQYSIQAHFSWGTLRSIEVPLRWKQIVLELQLKSPTNFFCVEV